MYKIYNVMYLSVCVILRFCVLKLQMLAVQNYFHNAHKVTKNVKYRNLWILCYEFPRYSGVYGIN